MASPVWKNLAGTVLGYIRLGLSGVRLKNSSGNLLVRNADDSADANITAAKVSISGEIFEINSDAAGSGSDWKYTLQRPTSGMTAAVTLTLPVDDGSPNQVLMTDGSGTLSWTTAASTSACLTVDTTSVAFNSSSPVTMFTLPANAVLEKVQIIIDTAFDGSPTLTVGVVGTTSKYVGSTDNDLTAAAGTRFDIECTSAANGSTEALIVTYSQGAATVGAARVLVSYSVPA